MDKILAMALAYRQEFTDEQLRAYMSVCNVIAEADIEAAFSKAMLESPKFIPTAPAIVCAARCLGESTERFDSSEEYLKAIQHVERWGIELYGGEPPLRLSEAGEFAFRILGGRRGIGMTKESDQRWLASKWAESYAHHKDAEKEGHRLTEGEAREVLQLVRGENVKQLPAGSHGEEMIPSLTLAGILELSGGPRETIGPLSEEELQERREELRRQAEVLMGRGL